MTYDLKFKTTWDYKLVPDLSPKSNFCQYIAKNYQKLNFELSPYCDIYLKSKVCLKTFCP